MQRSYSRKNHEFRPYKFERNFIENSEGSVLISCGKTKVLVTAKIQTSLPPFMKESQGLEGWLSAEYSMLPGSTQDRVSRERGKPNARSLEIQRLIGRSLRAMLDLRQLPGISIQVDADVIQADGGTRTASITGAYIAVYDALTSLQDKGLKIKSPKNIQLYEAQPGIKILSNDGNFMEFLAFQNGLPIINQVAAISVGLNSGEILVDLDYEEDSSAEADANFVLTSLGEIIEIQATAEKALISESEFKSMYDLAKTSIKELAKLQNQALNLCQK